MFVDNKGFIIMNAHSSFSTLCLVEQRLDRHLLIYANDVSCYVNDTSLQ